MSKVTRHIFSASLVACLIFSSVGFTAVSMACPNMMAKPGTACPKCKHGVIPSKHAKDCCKKTFEHKVVKTEFEKPEITKSQVSLQIVIPAFVTRSIFSQQLSTSLTSPLSAHIPISSVGSMEKCALLSTFLI